MTNRINYLCPECYVDTNIIKTLLNVDGVNHQHSCTKVMGCLRKNFQDEFAIGIVDDDKKKTYDYSEFEELARSEHLILMKHKSRMHFLIFVHKAAEDLLLSCAKELGINMANFNLPSDLEGLKEITKDCESDKEPRIKQLVKALQPASEMARLQRTIDYLCNKQYQADKEKLIELFNQ